MALSTTLPFCPASTLLCSVLSTDKYKIKMSINRDKRDGSAPKGLAEGGGQVQFPACTWWCLDVSVLGGFRCLETWFLVGGTIWEV